MRDYAKVSPQFWTKGSGKRLRGDSDAQVLALYLVTCPSANMIGIYYVPFVAIAHETGLGEARAKAAMTRLAAAGFADYDDDAELAWVPNMAAYQIGDAISGGDKRHKGILGELGRYAGHRFAIRFLETYSVAYGIERQSFGRAELGRRGTELVSVSAELVSVSAELVSVSAELVSIGDQLPSPLQGASWPQEAPPKGIPRIREDQDQDQESEQEQKINMSEFQTPTSPTPAHAEVSPESRGTVDVAPGRPTETPIAPDSDPEPKASQRGEQAPSLACLSLAGVDTSPRVPVDVQAVFDHWVTERGKIVSGRGPRPKLDDKRRKFIASRLKTWSADELRLAITGACNTPWNRGDEGGKVFLDLELILRDAGHIERYGLAAPRRPTAKAPPPESAPAKPAATDEELAAFFADNVAEPFAPGSDMYADETEAS